MERNNLTEQEYYELVRDLNIPSVYNKYDNVTNEMVEVSNGSDEDLKTYDEAMRLLND